MPRRWAQPRNQIGIAGDSAWRQTVGFGEYNIECDDRRTHCAEFGDELSQLLARPWPLAELGQRGLVDINDADRQILLFARPYPLQLIKTGIAQILQEGRIIAAQEHQADENGNAGRDTCP